MQNGLSTPWAGRALCIRSEYFSQQSFIFCGPGVEFVWPLQSLGSARARLPGHLSGCRIRSVYQGLPSPSPWSGSWEWRETQPPGGAGLGIVSLPFTGERSSGRSFPDHFSPFLLPALLCGREEEAPAFPHAGPHAPRARIVLDLISVIPLVARSPFMEGSPPW